MEALSQIFDKVDGLIWGAPLLIALMAVGIMLTSKLHLIQVSNLILSLKLVFSSKANADDASKAGDISGFAALCTALASTIGTGNIVGVATAVHMGGPGALFWMFVAAFFGLANKKPLNTGKLMKRVDTEVVLCTTLKMDFTVRVWLLCLLCSQLVLAVLALELTVR